MERGEWQTQDWSHQDQLDTLTKYLPIFTASGFRFSEAIPAKLHRDVIELGGTCYGPEAEAFMHMNTVGSEHGLDGMNGIR
jgi:hypothetical protein